MSSRKNAEATGLLFEGLAGDRVEVGVGGVPDQHRQASTGGCPVLLQGVPNGADHLVVGRLDPGGEERAHLHGGVQAAQQGAGERSQRVSLLGGQVCAKALLTADDVQQPGREQQEAESRCRLQRVSAAGHRHLLAERDSALSPRATSTTLAK